MGVSPVTQSQVIERNNLLISLRALVQRESFQEDPESFSLWLDLLRILSFRAQSPMPLGAPLKSVFMHFNRHFELDYIESQWELIELLDQGDSLEEAKK